jgi:hypothetical protein
MSTLTNQSKQNSVIIKDAIILNIMHDIFNIRNTEVVVYVILVPLTSTDGLHHHSKAVYIQISELF